MYREVALRLDAAGRLEQLRFNEYDRGDLHPEAHREFLPHWSARAPTHEPCAMRSARDARTRRDACPLHHLTPHSPTPSPSTTPQGASWSR